MDWSLTVTYRDVLAAVTHPNPSPSSSPSPSPDPPPNPRQAADGDVARLEQLCDAGTALAQAQRTEIGDVNETVFLAFADVDERGIDTGENVFYGPEIHITNLVTSLGNDEFINPFVVENCGDTQLLSDDDLLWHGLR